MYWSQRVAVSSDILGHRLTERSHQGVHFAVDTVDLGEGLVDGSATIIVQGADGTQHVLTQQQLSQLGVTGLDDMPSADLMTVSNDNTSIIFHPQKQGDPLIE